MAKQGILLTVAGDQEGATPRIVTEAEGLPVNILNASKDAPLNVKTTEEQAYGFARQEELLTSVLLELKILNVYMSLSQDVELTEDDVEE